MLVLGRGCDCDCDRFSKRRVLFLRGVVLSCLVLYGLVLVFDALSSGFGYLGRIFLLPFLVLSFLIRPISRIHVLFFLPSP